MKRKHCIQSFAILAGTFAIAFSSGALAQQQVQEDFTQGHINDNWVTYDGACLTAGDGTGSIPACVGLPYYNGQIQVGGARGFLGQGGTPASGNTQRPDPVGRGALRFTNGYTSGQSGFNYGFNQAGGIISGGTPFPSGAGLQVIFKTETYRGNSGGSGNDGADGMSFFLVDGSFNPYDTGAFGGSLGYTCSNANNDPTLRADGTPRQYDGLPGGYLGLGIDEYGNFLNAGDNTATGFGYQPGRIGLRGAGNISWMQLNAKYPLNYPSTLTAAQQADAVRSTCQSGFIWDYSNAATPVQTTTAAADYPAVTNGNILVSSVLAPGQLIANESAVRRSDGVPITYNLKITQDGILSLAISYNGGTYLPVITKQSITAASGALPSAGFRFGFAGSTGGSTNVHEIMCFQAAPADQASTSVAVNEKEATKIATGTQAYLAYYYPTNWTGRVTASDLLYDSTNHSVSISATANWDALCNLTGVPSAQTCPTTGVAGVINAQDPATRTMLTWNGSQGIPFEWSSLSSSEQSMLDQGDPAPITADRLNYLRGVRSNEINPAGVGEFRPRDGVLGDIINSSPTWVGPTFSPYASVWVDKIVPADTMLENSGTQSFSQFATAVQTRLNVVYTGANDGFLHGFRTGAYDVNGNYVNSSAQPNDGQEILAYMPGAVLQTIHNASNGTLDYANSQYSHNFFVDATPESDDLFYGGTWHTWLVGGLGEGGAAIYALNVTDPTVFSESGAGPQSTVIGEWSSSNISCFNVSCGSSMGNTYGVPVIRRLHNGTWAIIFGNGYNSATGDAGIFIMTVDPTFGTIANTYYLSTGVAGNNGIASVAPADLDGDHITDFVYAGDLLGNVWRFDLTSSNPANWYAAASRSLLFTVPSGAPITTKLLLGISPQNAGPLRMMVDFGTGRKFPQTTTTPATYLNFSQSLYGIWDWNFSTWNAQAGAVQFASLPSPQTVTTAQLVTQTLTTQADGTRDATANPVCWAGSTTCPSGNTQFGWTMRLIGASEQVVFNPLLYANSFVVNTTIPAVNSPTSCTVNTDTGFTIAVALTTGGADGFFMNTTDTNTAGAPTNGTGTPFIVQAGGQSFVLTQSNGNGGNTGPMPCTGKFCSGPTQPPTVTGKRLTWIKRR
jgi:type IV pilus assembly protein PilY1